MKKLYIVLAHTGTLLSRAIKIATGAEYTHASIALDNNLDKMYSFGRKYSYIAFIGGFVREGINFGTFKRFYNTEISVYEIEVTEEQYEKVISNISYIKIHKDEYRFNILGLILAGINVNRRIEKGYYCAEFVKKLLEKSNIDVSYLPETIKPEDFKSLKHSLLIYKGLMKNYTGEADYTQDLYNFYLPDERFL